jgi:hypothetical protein
MFWHGAKSDNFQNTLKRSVWTTVTTFEPGWILLRFKIKSMQFYESTSIACKMLAIFEENFRIFQENSFSNSKKFQTWVYNFVLNLAKHVHAKFQLSSFYPDTVIIFSTEMGESTQFSFAPKNSGEFLSIWAKFPQISKFFSQWTEFAQNFWGRTSTARIRPVRPKKHLLWTDFKFLTFFQEKFRILLNKINRKLREITKIGSKFFCV